MKFRSFTFVVTLLTLLGACSRKEAPLGSEKNPVKVYFVPSVEVNVIEAASKVIKEYLEANTPYKYEVAIPSSFVAVVEAFGTGRADVSAINTFGYILAHEKYGAEARLTVIRHGQPTYKSQFIAKADGPIKTINDLNGKKVAFVDPSSASGYLLPLKLLKDKNIQPAETMFAMRHDSVVSMIYQGQVDAGATFYSPEHHGEIQDARRLVRSQYPDVESKIKIIELTEAIPNDPVVFRKDIPEEVKTTVTNAFVNFVRTENGRKTFEDLYGVTDFIPAKDSDYDPVRSILKAAGANASDLMTKK